jgi:hypothetical protein
VIYHPAWYLGRCGATLVTLVEVGSEVDGRAKGKGQARTRETLLINCTACVWKNWASRGTGFVRKLHDLRTDEGGGDETCESRS